MDCCICSPVASIYRPPRNTICISCYEGAKSMVAILDDSSDKNNGDCSSTHAMSRHRLPSAQPKGLSNAFQWMKERKEMEEKMKERIDFLGGLVIAFKEGIHTDIALKPGTGPSIATHKALLAARSEIFRNILSSDECKSPASDTISIPELSHDELRCLLEFMYHGKLNEEQAEKHARSLLLVADKYDISYLKQFCEQWLLKSLDSSNALEILEASYASSSNVLREQAMNLIAKNLESMIFSERYEKFVLKNAHLSVEITRALFMK